ncbi:hypothetical protein [Pedobacter sp. P26]|uniref:hypothetical protein n=1 Tax=Pedobacter sp. P26 TaxID=3423956 RepID=UPI003D672583
MLVSTPKVFIRDYFIQLDKHRSDQINAQVKISDNQHNVAVIVEIPELNIKQKLVTDQQGIARMSITNVKNTALVSGISETLSGVYIYCDR